MTSSFVCDASVALGWFFEDGATPAKDALLDRAENEGFEVPSLWFLELSNILIRSQSRRKILAGKVDEFLAMLSKLQIVVDTDWRPRAFGDIVRLARHHKLTTYDATYLDLAMRQNLPLATVDLELRAAARIVGVELLGE